MKRAILGPLLILLIAFPALSQVPDDRLIVPGQRIGKWTLDMTITDLIQLNGTPTFVPYIEPFGDFIYDFITFEWQQFNLVAYTPDRQKVVVLALGARFVPVPADYKTDKAIGFDATRQAVEKAYGRPTAQTIPIRTSTTLIYDQVGLYFLFLNTGGMWRVGIFRPGTAKSIWKF